MLIVELQESNVKLKLTVVDSAGFGDQIDKTDRYSPFYSVYQISYHLKIKLLIHVYVTKILVVFDTFFILDFCSDNIKTRYFKRQNYLNPVIIFATW